MDRLQVNEETKKVKAASSEVLTTKGVVSGDD